MAAFSWTFSKLDNFETCAKKYYAYSVAKSVADTDTENIDWGNKVHDALRDALKENKPLPDIMAPFKVWVDRVKAVPGDLLVEQKYALNSGLNPVPWFAPAVWFRGIADVVRIHDEFALAIDWKTGKKKEDSIQLGLMALCIFQHFPKVKAVLTEFVWLKEDPADIANATTDVTYHRAAMAKFFAEVLPRVQKLHHAHQTMAFPPKPSGLCVRFCKVTECPFYGKGTRP
jgi:hypothetical protein